MEEEKEEEGAAKSGYKSGGGRGDRRHCPRARRRGVCFRFGAGDDDNAIEKYGKVARKQCLCLKLAILS